MPSNVILLRQQNRLRNRHAKFRRQRIVEELVVGRPPERIVDDDRPFERQTLQRGAIERHLVRDAIDYQVVTRRIVVANAAEHQVLSRDFALAALVDVSDQCFGKRLFPSH